VSVRQRCNAESRQCASLSRICYGQVNRELILLVAAIERGKLCFASVSPQGSVRDCTHSKEIEGHVLYLALGYFLSYLPYALLAKALSSGIVPGVDRLIASAGVERHTPGEPMTDAAYAILEDAGIIPHHHRSRRLTPEMFWCVAATALYDHTATATATAIAIANLEAVRMRPVEQFL
jgi:hypothetical protein